MWIDKREILSDKQRLDRVHELVAPCVARFMEEAIASPKRIPIAESVAKHIRNLTDQELATIVLLSDPNHQYEIITYGKFGEPRR